MFSFFSLALLALSVLSPVLASNREYAPTVTWLEKDRSFLVKIDTPGYPFYTLNEPRSNWTLSHLPTAFLLHFSLSEDNRTLVVGDEPFLPLAGANSPPIVRACQVPATISVTELEQFHRLSNWRWCPSRHILDFDRLVHPQDESREYDNHWPTVKIDILGAEAFEIDGHWIRGPNMFLDSPIQQIVEVALAESPFGSKPKTYRIDSVKLVDRDPSYVSHRPDDGEPCKHESWRCADFAEYPYYRFFWQQSFDEYGRIGSWRHSLIKNFWYPISYHFSNYGFLYMIIIPSIAAPVILVFIMFKLCRSYARWYNNRMDDLERPWEHQGLLAKDDEDNSVELESIESGSILSAPPPYHDLAEETAKPLPLNPIDNQQAAVITGPHGEEPPTYDVRMKPLPPSPHRSVDPEDTSYSGSMNAAEGYSSSFEEEQFGQYHSSFGDAGEP